MKLHTIYQLVSLCVGIRWRGAGHYQLNLIGQRPLPPNYCWGNFELEINGRLGINLLTLTPDEPPTRVLFGTTWARTHDNPGQWVRGRYGPNHLKHVQPTTFTKTRGNPNYDSYQKYHGWIPCTDQNHACLQYYSNDGNIEFLPNRYP